MLPLPTELGNQSNIMRRGVPEPVQEIAGLRERKKARLRQQIIETAIQLFRKQGYKKTRVDDIVEIIEISQLTFFRYFPSKDAVLRDVGQSGFECIAKRLKSELATEASTAERLGRLYHSMACEAESDLPLWQAVVLSGPMDVVRSPEVRGAECIVAGLLREILAQGQMALIFIRENYNRDIDLNALARPVCMGPHHLPRAFCQSHGITFHQYVMARPLY